MIPELPEHRWSLTGPLGQVIVCTIDAGEGGAFVVRCCESERALRVVEALDIEHARDVAQRLWDDLRKHESLVEDDGRPGIPALSVL